MRWDTGKALQAGSAVRCYGNEWVWLHANNKKKKPVIDKNRQGAGFGPRGLELAGMEYLEVVNGLPLRKSWGAGGQRGDGGRIEEMEEAERHGRLLKT